MSRHPSGSDHTDADDADVLVFVFFLVLVLIVVVLVFLVVDFDFVFLVPDGVDVDDSGVTGMALLLVPSLVASVVVVVSAVEETPLLLRFVGVTMVLSSSDAVLLLFFLEVRVAVCFFVVGVKGRTNSSASELSEDLPWNNRTLRLGCVPMLAISLVPVLVLPLLPVMGVEHFSISDGDSGNKVMIVLRFTFMLLL